MCTIQHRTNTLTTTHAHNSTIMTGSSSSSTSELREVDMDNSLSSCGSIISALDDMSLHDSSSNDRNSDTIATSNIPTHSPQHREESVVSLPDLAYIHSECGACPFCPDMCSNKNCIKCVRKAETLKKASLCQSVNAQSQAQPGGLPFNLLLGGMRKNRKIGNAGDVFITPCQLKKHNTIDSAWLLCGSVVYDATEFIHDHPGGKKSILRKAGGVVDCTKDMKFHSPRAVSMWKNNRIGILKACPGQHGEEDRDEAHSETESCAIM